MSQYCSFRAAQLCYGVYNIRMSHAFRFVLDNSRNELTCIAHAMTIFPDNISHRESKVNVIFT